MSRKETAAVHHQEIAHLAYLNWQNDGCPPGRDHIYWMEAEQQLMATKHLLMQETKRPTKPKPSPRKSPSRPAA